VGAFDEMFLVWLPTFPDLLGYLSHYGASYGEGGPGAEVQRALDEMRLTLKRAFQAWHGHRGVEFCHECDPAAALAARRQAMYGVP